MAEKFSVESPRLRYNHKWMVVFACLVAQMIGLGLTVNCFTLFLRDWKTEFDVPVSSITISVTLLSMGAALITPFIGIAADRFSSRWLFGGAALGLAVFHFLMSLITGVWQLIALYVIILPWAVGFAAAVPCQAIVSRWFADGRHLGLALGISAMGMQVGGVILPRFVSAELPELGWRAIFQLFGAFILVVALPFLFIVMREPRDRANTLAKHSVANHGVVARHAETAPTRAPVTTTEVLRSRNFWILLATFFPAHAANLSLLMNMAPLAADHGIDAGVASSLLIAASVAAMCAKVTSGALADRFGTRWPLVSVALTTCGGYLIIASAHGNVAIFAAGALLVGTAGGAWPLVASAIAAEFGAAGFGRAFGLIVTGITFTSFAPPIFAFSEEATGTYQTGLLAIAALLAMGAAVGLRLDVGRNRFEARRVQPA